MRIYYACLAVLCFAYLRKCLVASAIVYWSRQPPFALWQIAIMWTHINIFARFWVVKSAKHICDKLCSQPHNICELYYAEQSAHAQLCLCRVLGTMPSNPDELHSCTLRHTRLCVCNDLPFMLNDCELAGWLVGWLAAVRGCVMMCGASNCASAWARLTVQVQIADMRNRVLRS